MIITHCVIRNVTMWRKKSRILLETLNPSILDKKPWSDIDDNASHGIRRVIVFRYRIAIFTACPIAWYGRHACFVFCVLMLPTFSSRGCSSRNPLTLELTLSVIPVGLPAHIFHTLNAHTNVEHYICRVCVYAILAKQKSKEHTHTCFQVWRQN